MGSTGLGSTSLEVMPGEYAGVGAVSGVNASRINSNLLCIFLSLLMILSGCAAIGFDDDEVKGPTTAEEQVENLPPTLSIDGDNWTVVSQMILTITGVVLDENPVTVEVEFLLTDSDGIVIDTLTYSQFAEVDAGGGLILSLILSQVGDYSVNISILDETGKSSESVSGVIIVSPPEESAADIFSTPIIELEQPDDVTISGVVIHDYLSTCRITTLAQNGSEIETIPTSLGTFDIYLGFVDNDTVVYLNVTCGQWAVSNNSIRVRIYIEDTGDDLDGDGVPNEQDSCPEGMGQANGWIADNATDIDGDGCHDGFEDVDDDGDGILDAYDNCPRSIGWVSIPEYDYDGDGCHDALEDVDDDGDGINDVDDSCPKGAVNWPSTYSNDWDSDGCRDVDEDHDDDSDGFNDSVDSCPSGGEANWIPDYNNDWDGDGCHDFKEDPDDDNDGVNDVNASGYILDECPFTPLNSTDVNAVGCAPEQRDGDGDGINDDVDQCPGTPLGNEVNQDGCADIDGDGVFANVDLCPETSQRWTPDVSGCSVQQYPVDWNTGPYGDGRLDNVSSFIVPTLSGTWNFQNEWTGAEVYIFLFKYTDGNGNSNSGTWGHNPRNIILNLPDNAHLFYASYDTSYHSDVVARKADVENRLNANEESKWMSRVHFIDQRGFDVGGGLGQLISNWQSLYYGIDRFQQAREIGSLHDWSQGTSCCTKPAHFAFEAHTWNYEYESTMRQLDYGATVVPIFTGEWHSGGWGSGYSSYANATFPTASEMANFETLEVYAYNPCDEHRQRYGKGDGTYGGCHEWDYLHYLTICDADNSSNCDTEFVRYITSYGREGRWLSDISPYMWMIQDGGERRFKYSGANKMGLYIYAILFDFNEPSVATSSEYAFSGGQFSGGYNNESQYKRSHVFTPPINTVKVEIVATISGHGFGQDSANCAEFCDHEHHYYLGADHAYESHPLVGNNLGCTTLLNRGVVANQFGSWPYGRGGWCPGQDVEQWTYDITSWVDMNGENNLTYRGLFNGQEYVPQNDQGGSRQIRAVIWIVFYSNTTLVSPSFDYTSPPQSQQAVDFCAPGQGYDQLCSHHLLDLNNRDFGFGTATNWN